MAEVDLTQDEQRPPVNGTGETSDDDPQTLKAKLAELERKYGTLVNEKKRSAEDRKKLTDALKQWNALAEEHGVEPEQLKALLSQREESELKNARDKGEIDKLLENQRKKFEKELEAERELRSKTERINEAITIDQTLDTELDKIGIEPRLKRGAFALHRPKVKIIPDPDARHGIATVVEVGGDHMPVGDYLKNWAENDPDALGYLKASQASGGGANAGRGAGAVGLKPRSKMTAAEKSQFIRARGKVAYDALPWT